MPPRAAQSPSAPRMNLTYQEHQDFVAFKEQHIRENSHVAPPTLAGWLEFRRAREELNAGLPVPHRFKLSTPPSMVFSSTLSCGRLEKAPHKLLPLPLVTLQMCPLVTLTSRPASSMRVNLQMMKTPIPRRNTKPREAAEGAGTSGVTRD